jgi:uncharacterized LabA/DUF88 family protein
MRTRRIAILIDGGFFIKRLSKLVDEQHRNSAQAVADTAYWMCKRHVQKLTGEPFITQRSRWLDHVYRMFYYDATPYDGIAHHPITNVQIQFGKTPDAAFRRDLFSALRRQRKFALRLGKVTREDDWHFRSAETTKKLLRTREWIHVLDAAIQQASAGTVPPALTAEQAVQLQKIADAWRDLVPDDLKLALRQKGVDMRIGIDITTLTLKRQVDTIILVTGDSDFVPAAKVARREGVEFILDPLWQSVNDDLHEHVDGVASAFRNPNAPRGANDEDAPPLPSSAPSDPTA